MTTVSLTPCCANSPAVMFRETRDVFASRCCGATWLSSAQHTDTGNKWGKATWPGARVGVLVQGASIYTHGSASSKGQRVFLITCTIPGQSPQKCVCGGGVRVCNTVTVPSSHRPLRIPGSGEALKCPLDHSACPESKSCHQLCPLFQEAPTLPSHEPLSVHRGHSMQLRVLLSPNLRASLVQPTPRI